ncbi:hypothetical protein SAMN05192558_10342 [Actinokineospora alba]|uniref:Uncharacterized protein n=1 Tax=Actinokineospora alba TaxID=504798 RepID=A0A1H0JD70_9PSEU|nr:hypothetical protein C8E96_3900 [Actinokineospora alba]SDH76951.1 hypothetical protein SAMN05421871_10211 [Actinokineospora alba]SDO41687.1 hypothetical protein SAMN05192558_10342 [Actinokineospora alba]
MAEASAWPVALRLALLLVTAFVAGVGLVQPRATGRVWILTALLAAVSAVLAGLSVFVTDVAVLGAVAHAVLVALVPALLGRPAARWASAAVVLLLVIETAMGRSGVEFAADTVYVAAAVAWFGLAVHALAGSAPGRRGQLALTLGGILVLAGAARLGTSGVAFDRRVHTSGYGLALVAVVALPLLVTVLAALPRGTDRAFRLGTAGIVAAFVAWSSLVAIPRPADLPIAGVPVLAEAALGEAKVPVLISPHRPGRNLVHFPASAGNRLEVRVADGPAVPATPRAGAEGTWAEVDLPSGVGEVSVVSGGDSDTVEVDPGTDAGPTQAAGVDGPECASAALGGLLAGRREQLTRCPSDVLSTEDETALRKLVGFLGSRGVTGLTIRGDDSPRASQAAEAVRSAAAEAGLRIDPEPLPDNALVVVAGWSTAAAALTTAAAQQADAPVFGYGLYLAPWLLNTPLATSVTTVSAPLRFDPREQLPVSYAIAVGNGFGGENPTVAGFDAWLGNRKVTGEVQIFAAAQVTVMPMGPGEVHTPGMPMSEELAGQWVPKATIVPVSAVLLG